MQTGNPWLWLVFAGLCEVVYAVAMPHTQSFTRLWPSLLAILFIGLSMFGLSVAMRSLPVGTAYAIWVGIGAGGTALVGVLALGESRDPWRVAGLALIIAGIALLKLTHKPEQGDATPKPDWEQTA